jgi:hypothetical protein
MQFKNEEDGEFSKEHRGGENLLKRYMSNPKYKTNATNIEVSCLKYPCKEFV